MANVCSVFDFGHEDLKYATNAEGDWATEIVEGADSRVFGVGCALGLDALGVPHVAYQQYFDSSLQYGSATNAGWDVEVLDVRGQGSIGWHPSMAMDEAGAAHLLYNYRAPPPLPFGPEPEPSALWYSTNASGAWVAVTVEVGASSEGSIACG